MGLLLLAACLNMMLVGTATASLGAITGSRDGAYGGSENAVLALGVNGGAVAGAIIAPSLDWSPRRARTGARRDRDRCIRRRHDEGLIAKPDDGDATGANGNLVAATMTAGLWGGVAVGVLITKESAPDPKFRQQASQNTSAAPTAFALWIGGSGHVGMVAGGSF